MKKTAKIIMMALSILAGGILFTSMTKNKSPELTTVRGTIRYQGNAPFEYECIKTDDNRIFTISADKKTLQEIKKIGTSYIEFKGTIIPNEEGKLSYNGSKDGWFEVESFKVIKE